MGLDSLIRLYDVTVYTLVDVTLNKSCLIRYTDRLDSLIRLYNVTVYTLYDVTLMSHVTYDLLIDLIY